jgi:outer membrane lipoprotein carrier protein
MRMRLLRNHCLSGVVLTALSVILITVVSGAGHPEDEVIDEIEGGYDIVSSVSGTFEQVMPLQGMGITREASGLFYIQKPGKSRWEYLDPVKQVFIVDGENLFYKKEKDESYRRSRIDGQLVGIFNVLLGGEGDLRELFTYSRVKIDGKDYAEVELIPQGKFRRDVKRVVLTWNRKSKLIEELTIFSLTGASNTLLFKNVEVNAPIPPSLFITQ